MADNSSRTRTTACFAYSLFNNSSNLDNTAVGYYALGTCNAGYDCTAVGRNALASMTSGSANTAVGVQACNATTTAVNNTAVGMYALANNTTGGHNTGCGYQALYNVTTGTDNIAVGKQAGDQITSGDNNLMFGMDSGRSNSPTNLIDDEDNHICMGNNSHSYFGCRVSLTATSDERDKTDITDFTKGLDIINSLRPVTYKWDMRSNYSDDLSVTPDGSKKDSKINIGLIAQEVHAVEKANGYGADNDDSLFVHLSKNKLQYGITYERLVPVLINAVKELSTKVTALEGK